MVSPLKTFLSVLILISSSVIAVGQSTDDVDDMAFFDIDDEYDEDGFFEINVDAKSEPELQSQYSLTGSAKQDFIFGI